MFLRFMIAFLAITGAAAIATGLLGFQFGHDNFWNHHGIFFLIFMTIFPRLTLMLSSVATGGVLWWLSFIFAPRILVAVLATIAYWNQNPILVAISWLVAFGGESSEKFAVIRRGNIKTYRNDSIKEAKWVDAETRDPN